jgi:hypothetical protein
VLQFVTWVVIITTFLLRMFASGSRRKLSILSIITGSITQLIPVLLLICAFSALLARLWALKATRPLASTTRLRVIKWVNGVLTLLLIASWVMVTIWSRAVPDALSGKESVYGTSTYNAHPVQQGIQAREAGFGYEYGYEHGYSLIHVKDTGAKHFGSFFERKDRGTIDMGRLSQLAYAITFACLTYSIMIHARKVNGYLLLPDQVSCEPYPPWHYSYPPLPSIPSLPS